MILKSEAIMLFGLKASGEANTLSECYKLFIEPHLPDPDIVSHWHHLLLDYLKTSPLTVFVRRGSQDERRGMETRDPTGFGYVFCDNSFPKMIYEKVCRRETPDLKYLTDKINSRTMPIGDIRFQKGVEKELATFRVRVPMALIGYGLKLSHLYSVGDGYSFNHRVEIKLLCPFGDSSEWTQGQPRLTSREFNEADRAKLVAHFLRTTHPANYFLSPSPEYQINGKSFKGGDAGEDRLLIAYIREQFRLRYPGILEELEQLVMLDGNKWPEAQDETAFKLAVSEKKVSIKETALLVHPKISSAVPFQITFSTPEYRTATHKQFLEVVLITREAFFTFEYDDGQRSAPVRWEIRRLATSSSILGNIRGRFRSGQHNNKRIKSLHVSV